MKDKEVLTIYNGKLTMVRLTVEIKNKEILELVETGKSSKRKIPISVAQKICLRMAEIRTVYNIKTDFPKINPETKRLYLDDGYELDYEMKDWVVTFKELIKTE